MAFGPYHTLMIDARHYRLGETGSHIRQLQTRLERLGYSVPLNGVFCKQTFQALTELEFDVGRHGTSTSFCVDTATLELLFEPRSSKSKTFLPHGTGVVLRFRPSISQSDIFTRLSKSNVSWLAVKGSVPPGLAQDLANANCQLWLLRTVTPKSDASELIQIVSDAKASGLIIQLAPVWRDMEERAFEFAGELLEAEFPVGVLAAGEAASKETFPLGAFHTADFGVPQNFTDSCPLDKWSEIFDHVIPLCPGFDEARIRPSRDTVLWWDWDFLSQSEKRWDMLKETTP